MKQGSKIAYEARITARFAVVLAALAILLALSGCNTYKLNYIANQSGGDCVYYFVYKEKEYSIVDSCGRFTYDDKFTPAEFKRLKK
jgi:hypothetical protein